MSMNGCLLSTVCPISFAKVRSIYAIVLHCLDSSIITFIFLLGPFIISLVIEWNSCPTAKKKDSNNTIFKMIETMDISTLDSIHNNCAFLQF